MPVFVFPRTHSFTVATAPGVVACERRAVLQRGAQ